MKGLVRAGVILFTILEAGCQKPAPPPSPSPTGPQTDDEKVAYALGAVLGKNLTSFSLSPALVEQMKKGAGDAALGNTLAVDPEAFSPKIRAFVSARQAATAAKQAATNATYLEKAEKEQGAVKTPSGLISKTLRVGTGASPKSGDVVSVSYTGSFTDGSVFDASAKHGAPLQFPLSAKGMIPCFSEGVQRMKVAEQVRLVCPPELAYGPQGTQNIPGGSILIFEIELLAINPPPPPPGPKK
jgi:FKBP-type peptidyl-prolyl cis-trans isomerase FkpA